MLKSFRPVVKNRRREWWLCFPTSRMCDLIGSLHEKTCWAVSTPALRRGGFLRQKYENWNKSACVWKCVPRDVMLSDRSAISQAQKFLPAFANAWQLTYWVQQWSFDAAAAVMSDKRTFRLSVITIFFFSLPKNKNQSLSTRRPPMVMESWVKVCS